MSSGALVGGGGGAEGVEERCEGAAASGRAAGVNDGGSVDVFLRRIRQVEAERTV